MGEFMDGYIKGMDFGVKTIAYQRTQSLGNALARIAELERQLAAQPGPRAARITKEMVEAGAREVWSHRRLLSMNDCRALSRKVIAAALWDRVAELEDDLVRIKAQRNAMQQAIRDLEAELAEATARVLSELAETLKVNHYRYREDGSLVAIDLIAVDHLIRDYLTPTPETT